MCFFATTGCVCFREERERLPMLFPLVYAGIIKIHFITPLCFQRAVHVPRF